MNENEKITTPIDWNDKIHGNWIRYSEVLVQHFRKTTKSGKATCNNCCVSLFGVIQNWSSPKKDTNAYGYCNESVDKLAWKLGYSYDTVFRALKILENENLITRVPEDMRKDKYDTVAYMTTAENMERLQELDAKYSKITYDNDPTWKRPKTRIEKENAKIKRLEEEIKRLKAKNSTITLIGGNYYPNSSPTITTIVPPSHLNSEELLPELSPPITVIGNHNNTD